MNIPDITPRGEVETLPKWAQQYIHALVNHAESLVKEIEDMGTKNSKITWWTAAHGSVGIPGGAEIEFNLGNSMVSVHLRDGAVHVNASGGSLKVYPRAANDLFIGVEDR